MINNNQLNLLLTGFLAIAFLLGTIFGINYTKYKTKEDVIVSAYFKHQNDTLTIETLYNELKINKVQHPEIVLKQAILETGHFTSKVFRLNNNLFGFYNGKRYLSFNSWQQSVKYYKTWQDKRYKSGDYYQFLSGLPYAEDCDYIDKLKQINI